MPKAKHVLVAGGVMSALISILHVVLAIQPALYRYVGPGQGSPLSEMAEQGSTATTVASVVIALIFAS